MANYNTREVVTSPIELTKVMQEVLKLRGAEVDVIGKGNVLDGMVVGALTDECTVTFADGWNDNDPEELSEWHEPEISDADKPEFDRLLALNKEYLFGEILKTDLEADFIELQAAWTCSKLRLDGFGGTSLVVNRKGYLYIITCDWSVNDDGEIVSGSTFTPWETEVDERAADSVETEKEEPCPSST